MSNQPDLHTPLFVRLPNWVGDACMVLPCLAALAQTGHPLIIAGRPWAKDLVWAFAPESFVPLTGAFRTDRRALTQVPRARRRAGLGLVMPDSFSSAALFFLAGIKSAGYRDDGRSLLLRWSQAKPSHPVHAAQQWWDLMRFALAQWAGVADSPALSTTLRTTLKTTLAALPLQPPTAHLSLKDEDRLGAQAALAKHNLKAQEVVLLAPTATGLHRGQVKVWPHFDALAQVLQSAGYQPVICPPVHEQEQARQSCPHATLLEPLPLRAFCALAQQSALVVCNDSGVSHLAGAVGARQITLFGVTDPARTRPWTDGASLLGAPGLWPTLPEVTERVQAMLGTPMAFAEVPSA